MREKLIELLNNAPKSLRYEELPDYLLENGVVALPFEVGDTLYYILEGHIEPCTVKIIHLGDFGDRDNKSSNMAEIHFQREDCPYVSTEIYFSDIGKTVFFTSEEAEKALERSKK